MSRIFALAWYIVAVISMEPGSQWRCSPMPFINLTVPKEDSFMVKAVLAHFFFGYIHPYFDGNGRTARFLMNFLFVVGGFNWVIVKQSAKPRYMEALESASVSKDIKPFFGLIVDMMAESRGKESI